MTPLLTAFWIIAYCSHNTRCDVVKDTDGIVVKKYSTVELCKSSDLRLAHLNSSCINVNSVSCYKGGSICTFDPIDDEGWKLLKKMVPLAD